MREIRHGKCNEISRERLLLLFPQEKKLESAQHSSRLISCPSSPDALQLQMPNFMAFFTLQTFVANCLDFSWNKEEKTKGLVSGIVHTDPETTEKSNTRKLLIGPEK